MHFTEIYLWLMISHLNFQFKLPDKIIYEMF